MKWTHFFSSWRNDSDSPQFREEAARLLPANNRDVGPSAFPAKEVTKIALRLKYQIEEVIPIELSEDKVIAANSPVITRHVVKTAKEAAGQEYASCVIYCLLVCKRWFKRQALLELWDADLHNVRAVAAEIIAKRIIEAEENQDYLMQDVLLKRYAILKDGKETEPTNVIERSVDLHALHIIGSSGYQKCVKYLWRGWLQQDDKNAGTFIAYKDRDNTNYYHWLIE